MALFPGETWRWGWAPYIPMRPVWVFVGFHVREERTFFYYNNPAWIGMVYLLKSLDKKQINRVTEVYLYQRYRADWGLGEYLHSLAGKFGQFTNSDHTLKQEIPH